LKKFSKGIFQNQCCAGWEDCERQKCRKKNESKKMGASTPASIEKKEQREKLRRAIGIQRRQREKFKTGSKRSKKRKMLGGEAREPKKTIYTVKNITMTKNREICREGGLRTVRREMGGKEKGTGKSEWQKNVKKNVEPKTAGRKRESKGP